MTRKKRNVFVGSVVMSVFLPSGCVKKTFYSGHVPEEYTPFIKSLFSLPENKNPAHDDTA